MLIRFIVAAPLTYSAVKLPLRNVVFTTLSQWFPIFFWPRHTLQLSFLHAAHQSFITETSLIETSSLEDLIWIYVCWTFLSVT